MTQAPSNNMEVETPADKSEMWRQVKSGDNGPILRRKKLKICPRYHSRQKNDYDKNILEFKEARAYFYFLML